ncbi:GGDEF domain-containing protein [Atopomonas sediminilitoris]|uniref:GGDEF domain-containing protein n=1 Tax=Atopomonas sediminilitoris TaxID=2919919 RepID=UPI001F4DCA0D|nr:GGDEF domain-containing protein [Atopomonas sediminilitoris]MCJ8169517.1 diguanylate cyclase [Atopomonas sediminilitoris]
MASNDTQHWKEKYLALAEEQEQRDKSWQARLDLLRRGLVRTSMAAEGSDPVVDQVMGELRSQLRQPDSDQSMDALIPRLEKIVLQSEDQREERLKQLGKGLRQLSEQLQELPLPKPMVKSLKQLAKQAEQRARHLKELPLLVDELSRLQNQVVNQIQSAEEERPGFWKRLLKNKQSADDSADTDPPVAAPTDAATLDTTNNTPPPVTSQPAATPVIAQQPVKAGQGHPNYAIAEAPEPGYSAIAEHIEGTLNSLLAALEVPDSHHTQRDALKQRVDGGLNWYELAAVLDELKALILATLNQGEHEFQRYLGALNERLASFQDNLKDAHTGYQESLASAHELDGELRTQVDGLQTSVKQATDLDSLKRTVESRLDGLLSTMDTYQHARDQREKQVAQKLQTLVEKVGNMEDEAKNFRAHLEEQKQKALKDALTGLPNRAAWDERIALESARWQRYGGDLLLAVIDVDFFKRINDSYGHLAGDKVLRIIAQEIAKRLRKTDFVARYGGEEFVVLLPATELEAGFQVLDTLRSGIEACPFHFKGEPLTITVSVGISAFSGKDSASQVFERADQALYAAKNGGRNQVQRGLVEQQKA